MTFTLTWFAGLAIGLLFGWAWGYTQGRRAGYAEGDKAGKDAMFFTLKRIRANRRTESNCR